MLVVNHRKYLSFPRSVTPVITTILALSFGALSSVYARTDIQQSAEVGAEMPEPHPV